VSDESEVSVKVDPKLQQWIDARKRHHLSHAHVQMARELGMNPKNLGSLDNHGQQPWKAPLPEFIEHLYEKRFGRARPEEVFSIEERARQQAAKQARKKARKAERGAIATGEQSNATPERQELDEEGRPAVGIGRTHEVTD
jgi:hypothetical protein